MIIIIIKGIRPHRLEWDARGEQETQNRAKENIKGFIWDGNTGGHFVFFLKHQNHLHICIQKNESTDLARSRF